MGPFDDDFFDAAYFDVEIDGTAALTGLGSLDATGALTLVLGAADLSGLGALDGGAGAVFVFALADLTGNGVLTVHGRVVGAGPRPRPYADAGGAGGGYYTSPIGKGSAKLRMTLPRVYTRKPELPHLPKGLYDVEKSLTVPLPIGEEGERQQRWLAFRAKTQASYPEFIAFEFLTTVKKLTPGIDFYFQYSFLGGRTAFGGFVLDFFFPIAKMAWFIQGLHFHYTNPSDRGRDKIATTIVASRGVDVVEVFEDDIINRTSYTLEHAYKGQEIRRALL